MRPFRIIWLEIARNQYQDLPSLERDRLDQLLARLAVDPESVAADYDGAADQWIADFADGAGLVSYAIVPANRCVIVLRLLTFE